MVFIISMLHLSGYSISRNDAATQLTTSKEWSSLRALRRCVNYSLPFCTFLLLSFNSFAQRQDISLNSDWLTSLTTTNTWKKVNIPHNWDDYYGYRRLVHGNLHGHAVYKKNFIIKQSKQGKRFFLFFEGVGSYATIYLNDKLIGSHAGGRTTFTLDVTNTIKTDGSLNHLLVKASHPSNIKDLPWVCGGCSDERGFSEGSQPMGIFRPVHLIVTNDVRVQPFGVHAWTENKNGVIKLFINSTLKNYSAKKRTIEVIHQLLDANGNHFKDILTKKELAGNDSSDISSMIRIDFYPYIRQWSPTNPYLYKIVTLVKENNRVLDQTIIDYGFRTINWKSSTNQFFLNNSPLFINGIAEYEH